MSRFFFFNDTATTEIYTLSLHDALPISSFGSFRRSWPYLEVGPESSSVSSRFLAPPRDTAMRDRKSTRLNSSHLVISYAVFCLKKKNTPKRGYGRAWHFRRVLLRGRPGQ